MTNIIYGFHSITTLIINEATAVKIIYLDHKRKDKRQQEIITLAKQNNIKIELLNDGELTKLIGSDKHQGIIAKINKPQKQSLDQILSTINTKKNPLILILDGITDPQNLGAIIRTAYCFNVEAIILPKNNSANVDNSIVAKTSSGAINFIPIITVNNISQTIEKLKENDFWIAGTSLSTNSTSLFSFKPQSKLVWVMGSESTGMRRLTTESCDYLVTIPISGTTQSLNVSVATGIVLAYTRFIQQK